MTEKRIINFNPGPAALPLSVLQSMQKELLNFQGTGMSVLEISHRSKPFEALLADAQRLVRKHFGVGEEYKVVFMGGGASLQFAMIPMNLMGPNRTADYVITGSWSKKALKEAQLVGKPNVAASSEEVKFTRIPKASDLKLSKDAVYVHITSNNTIAGTQWKSFPDTGKTPLVVDMSSDILCCRREMKNVGMVYAGAQKNLGPAGVTLVMIRDDLISKLEDEKLPTMLKYKTFVDQNSLYNTPPVFPIYAVKKVMEWIEEEGGVEAVEKRNRKKGDLLYGFIDEHADFYRGTTEKESRSLMNATFRLPTEELEAKFIKDGLEAGFGGLKGHRSVGGIRVSMYNAISVEEIEKLIAFMKKFAGK